MTTYIREFETAEGRISDPENLHWSRDIDARVSAPVSTCRWFCHP